MPGERSMEFEDARREAYKVNKLVDEELVSAEKASEASEEEIADMIEKIFNRKYHQNFFHPADMRDKSMGQKAEDLLIEILNRIPFFHARHATDREDAIEKTDLAVTIGNVEHEIPIQLATYTDPEKLEDKKAKLPKKVVLVALPMGNIFKAIERNDENLLKFVIKDFVRQVLEAIKSIPEYVPVYDQLKEQLATVRAA